MATVFIQKEKLEAAYRYANLLRTAPERDYANAYIGWLRGGAMGFEPERGRLARVGAATIKAHIDAMELWVGAL